MKKKRKLKNEVKFYFIELIFIILLIFSSTKIIKWYVDNNKNKKILDDISTNIKLDKKTNEYTIDFEQLKKQNADTVAYIEVKNTNIKYPVVKYTDNSYYLSHNFNKENNKAGWVFADYRNKVDTTDKNMILYGHNMRDKSMFGTLKYTLEKDWQNDENNRLIILITEDSKYTYEVFSTYKVKAEDYYIKTNFASDDEYKKFLDTIKSRSNFDYSVDVDINDHILTLSTCDYTSQNRVVLHAKRVN